MLTLYRKRKKKTNVKKLVKWQNKELKEYVKEKLNMGWSPEQISERLKKTYSE